jgi:hypothetical protein
VRITEGWLYDGTSAVRHGVEVSRDGDSLVVHYSDGEPSRIERHRLSHIDSRGEFEVYGLEGVDGWRLGVPSDFGAGLLPPRRRYGRWIDRVGLWKAVAAAAIVSVLVVVGAGYLPALIAPILPRAIEEAVGAPIMAGLGGSFCSTPEGDAALRRLTEALAPGMSELDVRIVSIPIVNAAALPGDHVLIFEPLLQRADGPDEVAGVLAHEIAHIENRHVAESMVRQLTFGLFIAMVGGNTGANLETFLGASYSRSAEAEADEDAIRMLRSAGISPSGAADFFARVAGEEARLGMIGEGLSYISSHPEPAARERRFRTAAAADAYKPPLAPAEWQALRGICSGKAPMPPR